MSTGLAFLKKVSSKVHLHGVHFVHTDINMQWPVSVFGVHYHSFTAGARMSGLLDYLVLDWLHNL